MNKLLFITLIFFFILPACNQQPSIEGLWVVKQVKVGNREMTPNARWMRFNADSTQQSGNGWFQHSYGTWKMNNKTQELSVIDLNEINDPYEPFKVRIENNMMNWTRTEDGENIEVTLEKSEQLPATFGDKILGLWKLEEAIGDDEYFSPNENEPTSDYIFFRWDRRFVLNSKKAKVNGVYNVNGHKPEVELIPDNEQLNRSVWQIDFEENAIDLKLLNTDSLVSRKFARIHEFPQ